MSRRQAEPSRPLTSEEYCQLAHLAGTQSAPAAQVAHPYIRIETPEPAERARHAGGPCQGAPRRRRRAALPGCRACGGAAQRRCGGPGGGTLHPQRPGRRAAATWRRPHAAPRRRRAGTDPGRGPSGAGPRAGWHRHLVAEHLASCRTPRARWADPGEHLDDLARVARGRPQSAARSLLVRHRGGAAQAQGPDGGRTRPGCSSKKSLIASLDPATGALVPLLNPRTAIWANTFVWWMLA